MPPFVPSPTPEPEVAASSCAAPGGGGGALVAVFRTLCLSREIDRRELDFVRRGEAFFHVSGAGHEASAAIARHLTDDDWLHLHFRNKALLLARGVPISRVLSQPLLQSRFAFGWSAVERPSRRSLTPRAESCRASGEQSTRDLCPHAGANILFASRWQRARALRPTAPLCGWN